MLLSVMVFKKRGDLERDGNLTYNGKYVEFVDYFGKLTTTYNIMDIVFAYTMMML